MANRLHSATRWPVDPQQRLELAVADLDFCDAIESIWTLPKVYIIPGWMNAELIRLRHAASEVIRAEAKREIDCGE